MTKEQIINKWLPIISDDYMHFSKEQMDYAKLISLQFSIKEYDNRGVMMWATVKDIDSVKRTQALLFYIKPEYRGSNLFLTMVKNLERIAIEEESEEIIIGRSISGYKEQKFNKFFMWLGYTQAGFIKKVRKDGRSSIGNSDWRTSRS